MIRSFLTLLLLIALSVTACNSSQREKQFPPMSYGDNGPFYTDSAGKEIFQLVSEGEEGLTVKIVENNALIELQNKKYESHQMNLDNARYIFENTVDSAFFRVDSLSIYEILFLNKRATNMDPDIF